jgi:protein ImuA
MLDSHAAAGEALRLAPGLDLARGRAHEATGPARRTFALLVAAATSGPVLWLHPAWERERLMGDGLRGLLDPGRLVFGGGRGATDLLWAAEEALRSGLVPLIVAEMPAPPALTPVRRLHLAATAGGGAPLMLLLTPDPGGAAGVETRWHIAPAPGWARDGAPRWRLARLRARMAPPAVWEMAREGGRVTLAPQRDAPTPAGACAPGRHDVQGPEANQRKARPWPGRSMS